MKNISFFSENFQFLEMKFSIYLNRRVFVMFNSISFILIESADVTYEPRHVKNVSLCICEQRRL